MQEFNVIYRGDPIAGHTLDQVRQALGGLLAIADKAELNHFFSGRPATLLKQAGKDDAMALQHRLEAVGVKCDIEPVKKEEDISTNAAASTDRSFEHLSLAPLPEPAKSNNPELESPVDEMVEPADTHEDSGLAERGKAVFEARELSPPPPVEPARHANHNTGFTAGARTAALHMQLDKNTSGRGAGVSLPSAASGWCWGGFLLGWIWGIFNGTFIGLLSLVPVINLPVVIMLGIKGREWAWRNKRWQSVEHFNRVQRNWSIVGVVALVIGVWLWLGAVNKMEEAVEGMETLTSAEMEQQLEKIDNPEVREQMRQLIELQKQLEKQMETLQ